MNIITEFQLIHELPETHPIIQSIIDNKLEKLKKLLKDKNPNDVYPCKDWSFITPLTATIVYQNMEICTYLLHQGVDPDSRSQSPYSLLHYVLLSRADSFFVEKLLKAKANPNGIGGQIVTPLHFAAVYNRDDVMKALISAGAMVTLLPTGHPDSLVHNKKIAEMTHNFASKGHELCAKIRYFLDVAIAVPQEPPEQVFRTFNQHMLLEDPRNHLTMIEILFTVSGKDEEKYREESIKWLKEKKKRKNVIQIPYKSRADVQVAGMLIYYILSGGEHPFGEHHECVFNIHRGEYSLDHVQDVVAKDLIEWMINREPNYRPRVEECLRHPFFWLPHKQVEYLRVIGNREEVANCRKADQELINSLEECAEGGSFKEWKKKFPQELVQRMDGKKKAYPESTLGLLRFIRNLHEHYAKDAAQVDITVLFPDLFGCIYKFAKTQGWNSETPLKEMFRREDIGAIFEFPATNTEELLNAPVQESEPCDFEFKMDEG